MRYVPAEGHLVRSPDQTHIIARLVRGRSEGRISAAREYEPASHTQRQGLRDVTVGFDSDVGGTEKPGAGAGDGHSIDRQMKCVDHVGADSIGIANSKRLGQAVGTETGG